MHAPARSTAARRALRPKAPAARTISCPSPVAYARLAATRLAMRSMGSVTSGQPPHSTSQPVV